MLLLLGLAVLGHGARLLFQRSADPPGQLLADSAGESDPAAQRARALRTGRPLAPGETVDLNVAQAEEIARLPGVGMSLAKRIVAQRTAHGSLRSIGDLDQIPGVGPALLRQVEAKVRFGGVTGALPPPGGGSIKRRGDSTYEITRPQVDLNTATESDLLALPGIGPARARAIVAYRRDKGPFAAVSDLRAVPGISQSLVGRLAPFVMVR